MARNTTPRNTACRNASSLVDVRNSHDRELQPSASFHRKRLWTASSFHVKYFLLLAAYMRDYIGRSLFYTYVSSSLHDNESQIFHGPKPSSSFVPFPFRQNGGRELLRSFCKRRRDTLFIDLRSSYNNHTFDEIFSRRGFRTSNRPAFAFIVFDRIANTRVLTKRQLKIFKDEIEGSSLIFKKIREISEEETANSAQVNPCESFHLVIHIGYEDRLRRSVYTEISDRQPRWSNK